MPEQLDVDKILLFKMKKKKKKKKKKLKKSVLNISVFIIPFLI